MKYNIIYYVNKFDNIMESNNSKFNSEFLKCLVGNCKLISNILIPEKQPNESICFKTITKPRHIGWKCLNCIKTNDSIICNQCFQNNQVIHNGHLLLCIYTKNGVCDCGNIKYTSSEGFCSVHKGMFLTNEEINNYLIKDCNLQTKDIHTILSLLFSSIESFVKYFNDAENANEFSTMSYLSIQLSMKLSMLCKKNQAIVHILPNFIFRQVKDLNTKHQCISINPNDFSIKIINPSQENHKCICNLFTFLVKSFDFLGDDRIVYQLSKNYKLYHYLGLFTFILFPTFRVLLFNTMVTFMSNNVCKVILNNEQYWNILFNIFLNNCKQYLDIAIKKYKKLKKDIARLITIIKIIISQQTIENSSVKYIIYKGFIDLLDLLHNYVIFVKEKKLNINSQELIELKESEIMLLLCFESLVSFESFQKQNENINFQILNYLVNKIENKHKNNELGIKGFSYFISLYRALSIYITRFAFGISVHNNSYFYESIIYIMKHISNYESVFTCIYKYMLNHFEFNMSIYLGLCKQYDKTLTINDTFFLFMLDFSLMKILLGIQIPSIVLSIQNDTLNMLTNNDVVFLINENNANLLAINKIQNKETKFLFNCKMFELILKIIRSNYCFLYILIGNKNHEILSENKDSVLTKLLSKEKASISAIIKQHLIVSFTVYNIKLKHNMIFELMYKIGINLCNEIIKDICIDNNHFYSTLKSELLKYFDSSLIFSFNLDEVEARKFFLNNKSKKLNFLNTIQLTHLKCLESLQQNINKTIYTKSNINAILNLFIERCQSKHGSFNFFHAQIIAKSILSMITFINKPYSNIDKYFIGKLEALIMNQHNIIEVPEINNIYNYVKQTIVLNKYIYPCDNTNIIKEAKLIKSKYKTKYKHIIQTYLKEINNEYDNEPICSVCKTLINKKEDNFGYIGCITNDLLMYNMTDKGIKEIHSKHSKKIYDEYATNIKLFFKKKGIRIYNEGTLIHFSCFEHLIKHQKSQNEIYIPCMSIFNTNSNSNQDIVNSSLLFINSIVKCKYNGKKQIKDISNECCTELFSSIFRDYFILLTSPNYGDDNFKFNHFYILAVIIKSLRVLINEKYFIKEHLYSIFKNKINEIYDGVVWKYLLNKQTVNERNIIVEILFLGIVFEIFNKKSNDVIIEKIFPLIWIIRYLYEIYLLFEEPGTVIFQDKLTYNNMKKFYNKTFNLENSESSITEQKDKYKEIESLFKQLFSFFFLSEQLSQFIRESNQQSTLYKQFTMSNNYPLYINFLNSLDSVLNVNDITSHLQHARDCILSNNSFNPLKIIDISILPYIKPFIINLPQHLSSLYEQTFLKSKIIPNYWEPYCICLHCGELLHFNDFNDCLLNNVNIFNHVEDCFGGYGVVCSLKNTQVFIVMEDKLIKLNCFLYKNVKDFSVMNCITNDNVLNEQDYKNVWELYVTMNNIIDKNSLH